MADNKNVRRGLGRGLSALMADIGIDAPTNESLGQQNQARPDLHSLSVEAIVPNP